MCVWLVQPRRGRGDEPFPLPGESLTAHNSMMGPGGGQPATARAPGRACTIGKVGNDDFGTFARRHLEKTGFDAITLFTCKETHWQRADLRSGR